MIVRNNDPCLDAMERMNLTMPSADPQPSTAQPILSMRGVTKRFQNVLANDRVDLDIYPGEIHALLGENGAGKSTLMNILYGLLRPSAGEIRLRGRPLRLASPRDAIRHHIGVVHQHFMLIPNLSV